MSANTTAEFSETKTVKEVIAVLSSLDDMAVGNNITQDTVTTVVFKFKGQNLSLNIIDNTDGVIDEDIQTIVSMQLFEDENENTLEVVQSIARGLKGLYTPSDVDFDEMIDYNQN